MREGLGLLRPWPWAVGGGRGDEDPGAGSAADNPAFGHARGRAGAGAGVVGVQLRSRYSFHGDEADEVDVAAGALLTAIDRNEEWWVVRVEDSGVIGVNPDTYVVKV